MDQSRLIGKSLNPSMRCNSAVSAVCTDTFHSDTPTEGGTQVARQILQDSFVCMSLQHVKMPSRLQTNFTSLRPPSGHRAQKTI